jgi:ubiquinone/menaquinone biosynthesis C-methylase UbiE
MIGSRGGENAVNTKSFFGNISINTVSDYWTRRPCNIRHSPKPIGTREYFDEVEDRKYFVEPHICRLAQFPSWAGKRVLEIGCGIGTDTINFARHGATVTAVDLTEASLTIARRRAEVYGLENRIRFYQANAEELTRVVPIETYDLVYSFGVIHHTPCPENALQQIRAYLGPRSELRMMIYHTWSWKALWVLLRSGKGQFWRMRELMARYAEAQTGCPVAYTYTRHEARQLLEQQGYQVTDLWVDHIFPYRIRDYKEYRYRKVWYFRFLPRPVFRALENQFGWHLCLTARPSATAHAVAA